MKRFLCLSAVLAVLGVCSVHAETDYLALPKISDIQRGVDNANQIQELRVRESVTVEDVRWDNGSGLIDTAALETGPGAFTTLSASGATTLSGSVTVIGGGVTTRWDNASSKIDGEAIADDTIDDDSIDFADVTGADLTLTDSTSVRASVDMRLGANSVVRGYSSTELLLDFFPAATNTQVLTFAGGAYDSVPSIVISYRTTAGSTQEVVKAAQIISATTTEAVVDCDAGLTCDVVVVGVNAL
ncbi:MAG: hypothetical protein O3B24_11355 [Verrucomicrobia bacterium]|nr:hypothetical protein [Verrucomicrobiota bacterium]